ncbi:helix-turn-helix domain-containing protein [Vibrio salinus]|uniref:helix-turn-helix domain-containing protein n=1 Tax=Vibrio salinus TaxID=2899784 RepID=UPI001E2B5362|nr:AraC family transcriptional regulator [Vibrio salinus]MCE0495120.1 AraC family transcriptional regulator [Vibrio salinus]
MNTVISDHKDNSDMKVSAIKPAELVTLPSEMNCHDHNYTQIVIGLRGEADFEIEGHGNRIGPGKGCIVSSCSGHAFGGVVSQSDILVLNLCAVPPQGSGVIDRINHLAESDMYFYLDGQIQRLIKMLSDEMKVSPDDELLSQACNDTLMALLQRHIKGMGYQRGIPRLDLNVIDRYIEKHIAYRISVAQLAGSIYLGESQFHHLFKQQTGVTPHQYVLSKRIDIAKSYIEEGRYTLGQIAELTGFSAQSTFAHVFSRLQGISPSQYKKHYSVQK